MFGEVSPVSHISLKTDWTDYRERSWKTIRRMNVIDSSTKGFLEILSNVLVAQERSLALTYGGPNESCSSFTLMYLVNAGQVG